MGIRTGISGWTYEPWRGRFYPPGLSPRKELAYAASKLSSIEINGTFYALQRPGTYESWRDAVPEDYVFAVKAPRYITHIRRLRDARAPLANFFASGVLLLGPKLGPILWQLPPSLRYDAALLNEFLGLLPPDVFSAARLGAEHDGWLAGRTWLKPEENRPLRHALEVRHRSFEMPEFVALLREHAVALVTADTAGRWPVFEDQTAGFAYARLHGDKELYASGYTPSALARWARKVRTWARGGRDVFVYFDNDVKVRAPHDAMVLAHLLGISPKPGKPPPVPKRRGPPRPFMRERRKSVEKSTI